MAPLWFTAAEARQLWALGLFFWSTKRDSLSPTKSGTGPTAKVKSPDNRDARLASNLESRNGTSRSLASAGECFLTTGGRCRGMSDHKFKIGQFVNCRPRVRSLGPGVYRIAQLMPSADDEPQYRIRSETGAHLRYAMESELRVLNRG
jgi:hypothetical protein